MHFYQCHRLTLASKFFSLLQSYFFHVTISLPGLLEPFINYRVHYSLTYQWINVTTLPYHSLYDFESQTKNHRKGELCASYTLTSYHLPTKSPTTQSYQLSVCTLYYVLSCLYCHFLLCLLPFPFYHHLILTFCHVWLFTSINFVTHLPYVSVPTSYTRTVSSWPYHVTT